MDKRSNNAKQIPQRIIRMEAIQSSGGRAAKAIHEGASGRVEQTCENDFCSSAAQLIPSFDQIMERRAVVAATLFPYLQ